MPSKLRRVAITVSPRLDAALEDLRAASGMSPASFITNLMDEAIPLIEATTQTFKLAAKGVRNAADPMKELMHKTAIGAAQLSMELDQQPRKKIRRTAGKKKSSK